MCFIRKHKQQKQRRRPPAHRSTLLVFRKSSLMETTKTPEAACTQERPTCIQNKHVLFGNKKRWRSPAQKHPACLQKSALLGGGKKHRRPPAHKSALLVCHTVNLHLHMHIVNPHLHMHIVNRQLAPAHAQGRARALGPRAAALGRGWGGGVAR